MSKIVEFKIGKGCTSRPGEAEEWIKKYFELTVRMPEKYTEDDLHTAVLMAEYFVDNLLVTWGCEVPYFRTCSFSC